MARYPNYYALLGVAPQASHAEIRQAYRTKMLAQRAHPDVGGSTEEAMLINEAYTVLKDPARRAAYDRLMLNAAATAPASAGGSPGADRRRAVRLSYTGHVTIRRAGTHVPLTQGHPGRCRDISAAGLSFRTVTPLANGLGLTFIFADDPGWDVTGTVRWHRTIPQRFGTPIYEGGVEFQASDRARFSAFAARVGLAIS